LSCILNTIQGIPAAVRTDEWQCVLTNGRRARGGKAQWRRSDFIPQLPGCRQGTSLAPVAWHYCPAANRGGPSGLRNLDRRRDPVVAAEHRRGGTATSAHAFTSDHSARGSVTARTPRSWRARSGHGAHASVTARTLRPRRSRCGHGARATVTACKSQSLCARRGTPGTVETAGPAASAAQLTRRAQRSW
jgi:hypothetical protein